MSQATAPRLEITTSRQFAAWLADHRVSLAFTTYQSGKLFLIGLKPDGRELVIVADGASTSRTVRDSGVM